MLHEIRLIDSGDIIRVPGLACPECGSGVELWVDEWFDDNGQPTEGGVMCGCSADSLADPTFTHEYSQADWADIEDLATRWAQAHLRVRRDEE